MPIPIAESLTLPEEILERLKAVDDDFQDGVITKKGYCLRKWAILKNNAPHLVTEEITELIKQLDDGVHSADVYYDKLINAFENIRLVKPKEGPSPVVADGNVLEYSPPSKKRNNSNEKKVPRIKQSPSCDKVVSNELETSGELSSENVCTEEDDDDILSNRVPNRRSSRVCCSKSPYGSSARRKNEVRDGLSPQKSKKISKSSVKSKDQPTILAMLGDGKQKSSSNNTKNNRAENGTSDVEMNASKEIKLADCEGERNDDSMKYDEDEENIGKKPKLSEIGETEVEMKEDKCPLAVVTPAKCRLCRQLLKNNPDLHVYGGHPKDAVEEEIALVDPRLSLFTGDEVGDIDADDERPQNKITGFSVFDQEGHLCPFDTGLIEKSVPLYFSGFVKPIYDDNKDIEGGIPTKDMGPISEWWLAGFDGGESALIGFSSEFGDYILVQPSPEYAPFMDVVKEKVFMSKVVIEFLSGTRGNGGDTYEDLLNTLQTTVPPENMPLLTEDGLLRHAQFICEQVLSFDMADSSGSEGESSTDSEEPLLTSPCMRALISLAGVTFGKRRAMRCKQRREITTKKPVEWSKATTTPLVKEVFENFFKEQIDSKNEEQTRERRKRRRCGVCEACQRPDCGTCSACKAMLKFGGTGSNKQACVSRKCPNLAIEEAEESELEDEDAYDSLAENSNGKVGNRRMTKHHTAGSKRSVTWVGSYISKTNAKTYYRQARVEGVTETVEIHCHVLVQPSNPTTPYFVGRVNSMWEDRFGRKMFHAIWLCRGSETVLGETADPAELFWIDECEDVSLGDIAKKITVHKVIHPDNWALLGGIQNGPEVEKIIKSKDGKEDLWYQKAYDKCHGRFEDIPEDPPCPRMGAEFRFCVSCERIYLHENSQMPMVGEKLEDPSKKNEVTFGVIQFCGKEYRKGMFVFIDPEEASLKSEANVMKKKERQKAPKVDEEMYPEFYRKFSSSEEYLENKIKGSNADTPAPYAIGFIDSIGAKQQSFAIESRFMASSDIYLEVKVMFRPEDTHRGSVATYQADLSLLYWTEQRLKIPFKSVLGKCEVVYGENVENGEKAEGPRQWSLLGPNRFYFLQAYDPKTSNFSEPSAEARAIGRVLKGKGKGKGKKGTEETVMASNEYVTEWPKISNPLNTLDVFAGCGGLSEGLHQSGVAYTRWAIEKDEAPAHAFRLNNPRCTVFTEDCNILLSLVMDDKKTSRAGQKLPQKGEVELLCGGPPCQGFSGMNRFNSRQYSLFKNSLIVSYLSYCDYYRPRFFILENVRNFVSFKRSMVLKLTLRCLLRMGYQCSFGVLQAGSYGVPQTRRRAIIIAAAPGEILPKHPAPTHVFNPKACNLTVMVDDKRFPPMFEFGGSAPFRTITVRDALSDLPEIRNGSKKEEIAYGGEPLSHFQRQMRGDQDDPVLRDHICKEMAPIVEARMAQVPTASGSDWRDLPNIIVRLSDGSYTKKLIYNHHDKKNGRSSNGSLRGVCSCAAGKAHCDPMDRQFNTLIPWCLPHTANRHNNWAGLYGRLEWDGFFSTTITNPEPMGKQGRVLHPEQTRVVSVRECARSQGFPDTYRFFGGILDKHRQVGNAVPPPLGAAIGYEIRRSLSAKEQREKIIKTDK